MCIVAARVRSEEFSTCWLSCMQNTSGLIMTANRLGCAEIRLPIKFLSILANAIDMLDVLTWLGLLSVINPVQHHANMYRKLRVDCCSYWRHLSGVLNWEWDVWQCMPSALTTLAVANKKWIHLWAWQRLSSHSCLRWASKLQQYDVLRRRLYNCQYSHSLNMNISFKICMLSLNWGARRHCIAYRPMRTLSTRRSLNSWRSSCFVLSVLIRHHTSYDMIGAICVGGGHHQEAWLEGLHTWKSEIAARECARSCRKGSWSYKIQQGSCAQHLPCLFVSLL